MKTVVRLSIAPVKSMALQHPEAVKLERFGVLGNRRFFVATDEGALFNNSKHGPLMAIRADWDPHTDVLRLRFPDGTTLEGDATDTGRPIRSDFWGRPVHGKVLEGPWREALTEYAGRPLELVRPDDPGDGNDDHPVSIVSTASGEELARRSGQPQGGDLRRFRMLIEVAGCDPHEEDRWVGGTVRVGEAVVRVPEEVARCVITTKDPDTGLEDFPTLEAIAAYRGKANGKHLLFGVYGDVVEPGTIRVGDVVEFLNGHPSDS